jgi:hypothetical protein
MPFPALPVLGLIGEVLSKILPDPKAAAEAKYKLLELAQAGEFKELEANLAIATGQIEVNKIEAAQPGMFKGGWRPGAGWVCVFGLGYTFVARPLLPWVCSVLGVADVPPLPSIDTDELMLLLGGMLGLGGMRSFERVKGKA